MTNLRSGTVVQGALTHQEADYAHEFITHPVLGVVLGVYYSDDPVNSLAGTYQNGRGPACQARVLVVNDGTDQPWILSNVIITPNSGSGIDNFQEEIPRGVSATIDGTQFRSELDIPMKQLDGDWCVVDFIGGSVHLPFMVSWWPHPGNRHDPATNDASNRGNLVQGRRYVKRFQGTRFAITSKGDVVLDTNEANNPVKPGTGGARRQGNAEGGNVYVNVKESRELGVNFNPSVSEPKKLPDVLRNPGEVQKERRNDLSALLMNKDLIRAIAGQVMELIAHSALHLGTEADATENFVLGQSWKTLMETVLQQLIDHTHPTGTGPSGPSTQLAASFPGLRSSLDDQLSDWIFGQKTAPTP